MEYRWYINRDFKIRKQGNESPMGSLYLCLLRLLRFLRTTYLFLVRGEL